MAVRADSGEAGWKLPVNGAEPSVIGMLAESVKTVLTKFAPGPPTFENRVTDVPSGAIRVAVRSESGENARLISRLMSAIVNVPS